VPLLTDHMLICRLFGIHMNCCMMTDALGSNIPPDCKLASLTALLEWQALYAESMQNETVVWA
jgi:hypothetical protein